MSPPFVHLHTHSHYSLLDGLSKVKTLITRAKKYGMPALAITDHGNLHAAIEFYKAARAAEINPIIGIEAYVANRTRFDKEPGIDNKRYHLTLLAKNTTGYKNLLKLVTASHLEGYYYKPRMDKELLAAHAEGLIALSGCMGGEVSRALERGAHEEAERIALEYRDLFGTENYFLEIMHHPTIPGQEKLTRAIAALGAHTNIPLVATQDSHYLDPDDKRAHQTLLAVQTGNDIGESDLFKEDEDFSFISSEEAWRRFKDFPEAIENTMRIAERCTVELELGAWVFPDFKTPSGRSHHDELTHLTEAGLQFRKITRTQEINERIRYELEVIGKKGYAPYFLTVADLLRFARERGILTTTRGSAAGSMVSYLAGITNVDPLAYGLPFERFLNPYRPSPPDIDMDFADNRRDEVIEYTRRQYGDAHVAQIGTFGTMLARGVVRDVARALGHPYALGDKISRLIPMGSQGFPMTINRAFEIEPELKKIYSTEEQVREVIDLGKKLEGCVRHVSVHAAGVVISPTPLTDFVPLQLDPKGGKIITQYDMHAVEDAGLLKFDFLGIRNLSILADSIKITRETAGVVVDIENVPLDDKTTFDLLGRGETSALFQLAGGGLTRHLKDLKPTSIHDINAMVALYRPGPMANIPEYIARKHGRKPVTYYHPKMKKFLERSYGILVYQEDLLMTALELAGYTWESVDKFRKAVGKKIPEEMAKQHKIFVEGCIKHSNMTEAQAEDIWKLFEPFQGYGFNSAHAASYGKVAYQTAYMKANFPVEYMSAVLTADSGDVDKISETIAECARMGIPVLPPDVNESGGGFTIVKEVEQGRTLLVAGSDPATAKPTRKIRFGLYTIKNFGEGIANTIIAERKRGGKFASLTDFLERVQDRNVSKKSLEALIMSGAMDEFGERGKMLANMEKLLAFNRNAGAGPSAQTSLFSLMDVADRPRATLTLDEAEPALKTSKLAWEKELLGLYLSGHPLDEHRAKLEGRSADIRRVKTELSEGMLGVVAGLIENSKQVLTKQGQKMIFMTVADFTDKIEVVVFPRVFSQYNTLLAPEKCIAIKGRISSRNGEKSLVAEQVKEL